MSFPIINLDKTGANIHALRTQNNLSVRKLQKMLGLATPQAIYKWEASSTLPSTDNLVALSSIFKVPIENILVTEIPVNQNL